MTNFSIDLVLFFLKRPPCNFLPPLAPVRRSLRNEINDLIMESTTDRVLFVWLFLTGLFGSLLGVPYTIAVLMDPAAGGPVNPRLVWFSAIGEALLFIAPAAAVGVWLGKQVDLGPRLWRALVAKTPRNWSTVRPHFLSGLMVGFALGVAGSVQNRLPSGVLGAGLDNPSTFEYILRCLSAAITEEIIFRLGLVTLFVWIIQTVVKKPALRVPYLWIGSLLSALLFAGGHLPNLMTFGSPSMGLVIAIAMFSTTAGLIMGWLYIKYGLISAMIAHFVGDAVVYVLPRLLDAGY